MALRTIITLPDPKLRLVSAPIERVDDGLTIEDCSIQLKEHDNDEHQRYFFGDSPRHCGDGSHGRI